jgi:hypothetical protein
MCVAKCVKTAPRDPQRVEDRPHVIFHDFVGRWGPPISCHKKEARLVGLPGDPIVLEHGEQRARNGQAINKTWQDAESPLWFSNHPPIALNTSGGTFRPLLWPSRRSSPWRSFRSAALTEAFDAT